MRRFGMSAAICIALITGTSIAGGQGSNAAISGTVTDTTLAVLPGVSVTALNTRTGVASTTVTNEAGIYNFPSLQPGLYKVTGELPGFQTVVRSEILLEIGARLVLNFQLQVGAAADTVVEVTTAMDTALALGTSSIGGMITEAKVRELPLPARDVLGLIFTQAGMVGGNFAGTRIGAMNITRDGINIMDQHINQGLNPDTASIFTQPTVVFNSVDLVQEVRVVTSPADAEFGRGSGQIQILTRSGTNNFRGSVFESHRNTVLNANNWFNNLRGQPRNILIRNQYGGRLGGPIVKNKTFFHVLYEAQRQRTRNSVTSTVYTETARQGVFRFFPGVRNGNANAAIPTVQLNGAAVSTRPAGATGDLQSISVFGRDPARLAADRSGVIQKYLQLMPLPNDFRSGDGLNTAGYTWLRRATFDRDQINVKVDHTFSSKHNGTFTYTRETESQINGPQPQPFPDTPGGQYQNEDYFYSLSFTSTLTPRMVNEFRAGATRARIRAFAPWEVNDGEHLKLLPTMGSNPYLVDLLTVTEPLNQGSDGWGYMAPLYNFSDNVSWIRGRHTLKGGGEVRFVSSNPLSAFDVMPRARAGAGGVAVTGLTGAAIQGLGTNEGDAQNLLINLSGSLARIDQAFNASGPPNQVWVPYVYKHRSWLQKEFSLFFKDDFKIQPDLTLNLGLRYEYYGVPFERHGQVAAVKGGTAGYFGISGTGFDAMFQPGRTGGSLTEIVLVGKNSPNSKTKLYNDDWNNFAPAVGLSWSIPWFGKDKTVLRMGYGIGYERNSLRQVNILVGDQPGLRQIFSNRPTTYTDLTRFNLSVATTGQPLSTVPLTDRAQILRGYDSNLRTQYVQNWNLSVQREIARDFTLDVRYVANKGTKLVRGTDLNEANIFENGILDAYRAVQSGNESQLLDRIFNGLNLGLGAINGTTVRAAASLRNNANTRAFFANNNVGGFAHYLNTTTNFTGAAGGLLRRAGLAENFVVVNPQFQAARFTGNFANSTYHSMQIDMTKRFSAGWMLQSNFTWSKALGEEEGSGQEQIDSYRTFRDRSVEKRVLGFHRDYVVRNSGSFELPFGPGKKFLDNAGGVLSRFVERWQIGAILNLSSGAPFNLLTGVSSFNAYIGGTSDDNTPMLVGALPSSGTVTRVNNGVIYFPDLKQVADPGIGGLTTAQGLRGRSTLLAITDSSGKLVLVNPQPGQLGNLAPFYMYGPWTFGLDMNLVKRVRLGEGKEFEFRLDAIDLTNTPRFSNPTADVNSLNFGRITAAAGSRILVLGARVNF